MFPAIFLSIDKGSAVPIFDAMHLQESAADILINMMSLKDDYLYR